MRTASRGLMAVSSLPTVPTRPDCTSRMRDSIRFSTDIWRIISAPPPTMTSETPTPISMTRGLIMPAPSR